MSLTHFTSDVYSDLMVQTSRKKALLRERNLIVSHYGFFRLGDQPGFFTPWWEEPCDDVTMNLSDAVNELLFKSGFNLLFIVTNCLLTLAIPLTLNDKNFDEIMQKWASAFAGVAYFSVCFLMELALCSLSILTRSLASVMLGFCCSDEDHSANGFVL